MQPLRVIRLALAGFGLCVLGWVRLGAADASVPAATHRLELANGEVLIGTLVAEEEGVLVFRSQTWGEVRVPKTGARLLVLAAATAEPAGQPPVWVQAQPTPPTVAPAPAPVPVTAQAAGVAAAKWRRLFESGFSYQSRGTLVSSTSTYVRAEISRENADGKVALEGRYIFGKQDDQRNTDKLEAAFRVRQKFLTRIDFRNDFSYSFDYLKELSHQFEEVMGLNFIVLTDPKFRYSIGPGLAVQYAQPALGEFGFKLLGNVSHDFSWQFTERVSLNHTASYLFTSDNWADYRLRATTVLTGKITEQVNANLRYEYEFEAIRPVAHGRSDHRVFTTLGYVF